ncbi:MAG: glycosyltransferase [Terriglobales bacterium]
MAKITALIHTHNDAPRIGRAVESLRACDEVLVIDHGSTDDTVKAARAHGATVKPGVPGVNPGVYAVDAQHDWILCLLPSEAVGEALEASLFEWKERQNKNPDADKKDKNAEGANAYSIQVREEDGHGGWKELGPHARLVNRKNVNWPGHLPSDVVDGEVLAGHLLRFATP